MAQNKTIKKNYIRPKLHKSRSKTRSRPKLYKSKSRTRSNKKNKNKNISRSRSNSRLSRYDYGFSFRGGKKLSHQISTKNITATTQDKYLWNVSGTIEISDYPETEKKNKDKKWTVNFGFTIKEETSRGDKIPFEKIDFFDDQSVEIDNKESGVSVSITNSKSFSFRGILDLKKILKNQNPAFCALKFYTS